jgi:signal transduction histidine kinase
MNHSESEISVLSALGIAVLERGSSEALSAVGTPPVWLWKLLPGGGPHVSFRQLVSSSPFLADFVREAEDCWTGTGQVLESGTWCQRTLNDEETAFEAWALRSGSRQLLLIRLIKDFDQQRAVFQKLCDTALLYESLGRDHRKLREVSEALEVRNREVQRTNELKTEFLASVSHELKTPLNAIVGFSKLLEEEAGATLNPEQHGYLRRIEVASNHLINLINKILDLSKIEAGHLELQYDFFRFSEALTEVLTTIRPLARAKNIRIGTSIFADEVYADRLQFQQILYNLLSNAIKFTPDFGNILIECLCDGGSIIVAVADSGIGIPAEEQEAIFEKFHQVRSLGGSTGGTGLGLAIARRLVEYHGGKIWVESSPGQGACFRFTLPCQPALESATVASTGFSKDTGIVAGSKEVSSKQ